MGSAGAGRLPASAAPPAGGRRAIGAAHQRLGADVQVGAGQRAQNVHQQLLQHFAVPLLELLLAGGGVNEVLAGQAEQGRRAGKVRPALCSAPMGPTTPPPTYSHPSTHLHTPPLGLNLEHALFRFAANPPTYHTHTLSHTHLQPVQHYELHVVVALADQQLAEAVGGGADGGGRRRQGHKCNSAPATRAGRGGRGQGAVGDWSRAMRRPARVAGACPHATAPQTSKPAHS